MSHILQHCSKQIILIAVLSCKKFCISALSGGGGKTLISLGLARLLANKGYNVKPFKKGPDYIDSKWLSLAARKEATNLDLFLQDRNQIKTLFAHSLANAQNNDRRPLIALVEGNRGIFDGLDESGSCSTAELCKIIGIPIILGIDCSKITRTIAAILQGIINFDKNIHVKGVILNKIGSLRHEKILIKSIEQYTNLKIMGAMPRLEINPLPERHMGISCQDNMFSDESEKILEQLSLFVDKYIDISRLLFLAKEIICDAAESVIPLETSDPQIFSILDITKQENRTPDRKKKSIPKIGYVYDKALWFYYPENLYALENSGCELVQFSILDDSADNINKLKDVDGLYLGGGFPEDYADIISANPILELFSRYASRNMPIYAECGGLIILANRLHINNTCFRMAKVFSLSVHWHSKPQGLGYVEATVKAENPFFKLATVVRGHEFHYSSCTFEKMESNWALELNRGKGICKLESNGITRRIDGLLKGNVWASYMHIFAPAVPDWAPSFASACKKFAKDKSTAN